MALIFHAADLHIGARFEFLPEEKAKQAIRCQLTALQEFLQQATQRHADAVLIAGDLFDSPEVPPAVSNTVFSLLGACTAPIFLSPGNHDYYHARSPYTQALPSNLTVFTERTLMPVPLADGKTIVWGAAFQDRTASISLRAPLDPTKVNLCVVHGELGGDHGYNPISDSAVLESGFDYIALGHNHRFSGVFRLGSSALSCPGCFSPTSSAETGVKGYLSGTVDKGTATLDFTPTSAIRFEELRIPMGGLLSMVSFVQYLLPRLPTAPKNVACTIRLVGTSCFQPDFDVLLHSLQQTFFHVQIIDDSVPQGDLYRYETDEGILGMVTRDLKQRIDDAATEEEHAKMTLALEYALAALEGREADEVTQ